MDSDQLGSLTAELNAQLRLVERVHQRLRERVNEGLDQPAQLDSAAYQVHNLYCAAEDLLKILAQAFENNIGTSGEWHRLLLLRMSQPIPGIRPALLSEQTFDLMNQLRGFRNFIRHGYGAEIQLSQLRPNVEMAMKLPEKLQLDLQLFLGQLHSPQDC